MSLFAKAAGPGLVLLRWLRRQAESGVFLVLLLGLLPVLAVRGVHRGMDVPQRKVLLARWRKYLAGGLDDLRRAFWPGIRYERARDIWFHVALIEFFAVLNVAPRSGRTPGNPARMLVIKLAHFGDALHIFPMLRELLAQADGSIFCTREEAASFQTRFPGLAGRFSVVPNGVDADAYDPVWPSRARANRKAAGISENLVLFAGSNYKPNQEAAEWLVRDLAPVFSEAIFVVVGMDLAQYRAAGGGVPGRNVVFTGPVSERVKDAIFSLADVALAPMVTGTGSSLKIPDYLAHGKIVVGTPTGFRGFADYGLYPSVVIAEDVRSALIRVLGDLERQPDLFDDSCRAVRDRVKENLDWAVAVRPLAATLADPARSH